MCGRFDCDLGVIYLGGRSTFYFRLSQHQLKILLELKNFVSGGGKKQCRRISSSEELCMNMMKPTALKTCTLS